MILVQTTPSPTRRTDGLKIAVRRWVGCACDLCSVRRLKICHDPNNYNEHECLIICPEAAHAIFLIVIHQADKHANDGYPVYQFIIHKPIISPIQSYLIRDYFLINLESMIFINSSL
jgi:hypothetical protein